MSEWPVQLSIVIPSYNERENILLLIPQLSKVFNQISHEILVVDDLSPDGTGQAVTELTHRGHAARLISKNKKEGIGAALRVGYDEARGKYISSMDADLSFKPEHLKVMYDEILKGADLVVGNRHSKEDAYEASVLSIRLKRWVSQMGNRVLRFVTRIPLDDFSGNFRVIKSEVWHAIETKENTNTILFEMILKTWLKRFHIVQIPCSFADRRYGKSKLRLSIEAPKFLLKLLTYLVRFGRELYFRPRNL